jgi:hypothetical protein
MTDVDYSQWQPMANFGAEGDQQRDLFGGYWAAVGPETAGRWSWSILHGAGGQAVADGVEADEATAKAAVQAWEDEGSRIVAVVFEATTAYEARLTYADLVRLAPAGELAVPPAAELTAGRTVGVGPAWAGPDLSGQLWETGEKVDSTPTMVMELKATGDRA